MSRASRHRRRIGLLLVLCLLFQQAAAVAYACTLTRMPVEPAAMAEDCATMGMQTPPESPALCQKHCVPERATAADVLKLSVPALAVPAAAHALVLVAPSSTAVVSAEVPISRSDPPPRLRYCSLLI